MRRDARDTKSELGFGCPFCLADGHQTHLWDTLRDPEDPRWPTGPSELEHGMKAPDMVELYEERALRERGEILRRFWASQPWRTLGRDDSPRWTEHFLTVHWVLGFRPEQIDVAVMGATGLTVFTHLSDAHPTDATEIVSELRAYFRFADEQLGHPSARECTLVLAPSCTSQALRSGIRRALRKKRRHKDQVRRVRSGRIANETMLHGVVSANGGAVM